MNFKITETGIKSLHVIEPRVFEDERGYFFESYKKSSLQEIGIQEDLLQLNQSFSKQNVVRGLHFQIGDKAQGKLVRCLHGEIYDVAVDIRKSSSTFGKVFGVKLSAENKKMLYVPVGFAHGFSTLSNEAEVEYAVFGSEYHKESEAGIKFDDVDLKIDWQVTNPIISDKDQILPAFKDLKNFF